MFCSPLSHNVIQSPQVTRIDGTIDSPPCLKVTHKTFGTQNSNADMVFCRLSMPVEFHSTFKISPSVDINGVHEDESLKLKHRCRHFDQQCAVNQSTQLISRDINQCLHYFHYGGAVTYLDLF